MIAREVLWHTVTPGMYVLDVTEKPWRVEDQRGETYLLINRAGQKMTLTPWLAKKVTVLEPSPEEALATVAELLGAEVVYLQDHPKSPASFRAIPPVVKEHHLHLLYYHGLWTQTGHGSKSLLYQQETHAEDHTPAGPSSRSFVPHLHNR